MEKTIMAIGGHIGDAELTCGGILATLALKGYKVITVALTTPLYTSDAFGERASVGLGGARSTKKKKHTRHNG